MTDPESWNWIYREEYDTWDLMDGDGNMLCYITTRPVYCDRGHYLGQMNTGELDHQDMWPNYYMSLIRAKNEMEDFLKWRLCKIRCIEEE